MNLLAVQVSYQTQCSRHPKIPVLAEQPGVLATPSRWRSWVQIPSGTLASYCIAVWSTDMASAVLQRPTLVLNRHWQPVQVITVARALVQVWNATAQVIDPVDSQLCTWADWSALRPRQGEPAITTPRLRLHLPVLRRPPRQRGIDDRPCGPAVARRCLKLGELCTGLCDVQPTESEPDPGAGWPAPPHQACPPPVAARLCARPRAA